MKLFEWTFHENEYKDKETMIEAFQRICFKLNGVYFNANQYNVRSLLHDGGAIKKFSSEIPDTERTKIVEVPLKRRTAESYLRYAGTTLFGNPYIRLSDVIKAIELDREGQFEDSPKRERENENAHFTWQGKRISLTEMQVTEILIKAIYDAKGKI